MTSTALNIPRSGSDAVTSGVRVTVQPSYSSIDSDPVNNYFKFVYRIRITNESETPVQLVSRHWIIVDADGERQEVRGEGVVGQQPVLAPGKSFEYASFCPLPTSWGTMEGTYTMRRIRPATDADGKQPGSARADEFDVRIARFFLICPPEPAERV